MGPAIKSGSKRAGVSAPEWENAMGKKRRHRKNGGFTLVEVLVACAILGIALVPILSSFVSVAKVNTTSRKKLTATTVGESVMESVKAFELKEVAYQCGVLNSTPAEFKLIAPDLEKGGTFSGKASELTKTDGTLAAAASPSAVKSGEKIIFNGVLGSDYYFLIMDIPMAGTTYDALVTYRYVKSKSETTFDDGSGTDVSVSGTLSSMSIRSLKYYDVTVQVWKSEDGTVADRLGKYSSKSPLCELTGSKADYN